MLNSSKVSKYINRKVGQDQISLSLEVKQNDFKAIVK